LPPTVHGSGGRTWQLAKYPETEDSFFDPWYQLLLFLLPDPVVRQVSEMPVQLLPKSTELLAYTVSFLPSA